MRVTLLLLLLISTSKMYAQVDSLPTIQRNTFYWEFLGNGGVYSLNYDRILRTSKPFRVLPFLQNKGQLKVFARSGFSYGFPPFAYNHIFTFPMEIGIMHGRKHHLEISAGWTPVIRLRRENLLQVYDAYYYCLYRIGYRFQRPAGGFFLRLGVIGALTVPKYFEVPAGQTWSAGVALGWTLKRK